MDQLYAIFVYPLEAAMGFALDLAYRASGSYGFSICVLSALVNLAILPAYYLAERWKTREREIQSRMKPELDSIRAGASGYEAFLLSGYVHRRHGYRPWHSARAGIGVLIQIPFFFAAYHLLSSLGALAGTPFLLIRDLGSPDGLVDLGFGSENLLPLVMTVLNVASGLVYSRGVTLKERMQLLAIAALFLVLLYASPAGLVLYWTCTNAISLAKNLGTAWREGATASWRRENLDQVRSLIRTGMAHYPLLVVAGAAASMYCLLAAHALRVYGQPTPKWLILEGAGLILAEAAVALAVASAVRRNQDRLGRASVVASLLASAVAVALIAGGIVQAIVRHAPVDGGWSIVLAAHIAVVLQFVALAPLVVRHFVALAESRSSGWALPAAAALFVTSTVFLYQPAMLYSPFEGNSLMLPGREVIAENLADWAIWSVALIAAAVAFRRVRPAITGALAVVAVLFFAYSSVVPTSFGGLVDFQLDAGPLLQLSLSKYLAECALIAAIVGGVLYAVQHRSQVVLAALVVAHLLQGAMGLRTVVSRERAHAADGVVYRSERDEATVSASKAEVLRFSNDNPNVVFVFLDAFGGGILQTLVESDPSLADVLDGFVWYPNTLSLSNETAGSVAGMNGGWPFAPDSVNERRDRVLQQVIVDSYDLLFARAAARGFRTSIVDPPYFYAMSGNCEPAAARGVACVSSQEIAGLSARQAVATEARLLAMLSLFRSVPIGLKSLVYDSGDWWQNPASDPGGHASMYYSHESHLSMWRALAQSASAGSGPPTFKYLPSDLAHQPFTIADDCRRSDAPGWTTERGIASARCALVGVVGWLEWLKSAGIYDTTKVVVVSDHGDRHVSDPMLAKDVTVQVGDQRSAVLTRENFALLHALLLVKDFGSRGRLRRDDRFMSNGDTAAIVCTGFGGCDGMNDDPTRGAPASRVLSTIEGDNWLYDHVLSSKVFHISWQRWVRDSIFDANAWKGEQHD